MANTKAAHHRGTFQRAGEKIRAKAYADPTYRCPRCGLTLAEFRARHPRRNWRWQAGHKVTSEIGGELRAEHGHCNASHGASYGNRQRRLRKPRPTLKVSRAW